MQLYFEKKKKSFSCFFWAGGDRAVKGCTKLYFHNCLVPNK